MPRLGTDILIIGSGAGGGPLALVLARAGLDVLVLEKGPLFRREDFRRQDEIDLREGAYFPRLDEDPHTVVTPRTQQPVHTLLGWTASCVGGGTVHMGSFLYRFQPEDFRMRSRCGPYEEVADWPFGYDELEPWYALAEREVGLSGLAGVSPFEAWRSGPYPMPPLPAHPLTASLEAACRRRGLHPFPTPRGINSEPYQGRPACAPCDFCTGFGCPTGARGSSQEALLARAEETGRCRILPKAMARQITLDAQGRATGCLWLDENGEEHEVRARVVCVCCSAVESARLLLLSKSSLFPDGLANDHGLVGRHLQFHGTTMGYGLFRRDRHPELPLAARRPFLDRSLLDHYVLPPGVGEIDKGGLIRFGLAQVQPMAEAQQIATEGGRLLWGEALAARMRQHFVEERRIEFEVFHDFFPNARTFVALDPDVRDKWGLPVARLHLDLPSHQRVAGHWVGQRALEILDDLGADETGYHIVGGTSSYLVHGTCRAGNDPATSVLDEHCRAWAVPNLFVVDGSFMPTSGGAAPTLTILANSFRVADHILARARRGEFS
jgi:choline dehydrogenase-like flavoprotein